MAIELHQLNTHGMMEQEGNVVDGVVRLKARIAELEEECRWRKCSEESLKKEVEQLLMEIVKLNEGAQNLILDNCLKDEKVRHSNYKRCLYKAKWCHNQREIYERDSYNWELEKDAVDSLRNKTNIMRKWHKRWLELAEKFKDEKETFELVENANQLCKEAK